MTVRGKFLLFYAVMLAVGLTVAVTSFWATREWHNAANSLSQVQRQEKIAEQLRSGIHLQVGLGLDFLAGERDKPDDFYQREKLLAAWIEQLGSAATDDEELEYIENLGDVHTELSWRLREIFSSVTAATGNEQRWSLGLRLREIGEEGTDEVAALNRYYGARVQEQINTAMRAGDVVELFVVVSVVIILVQLAILIVLVQRLLVGPIASVSEATKAISKGAFDTRVTVSRNDEWGGMAQSINEMARSLKILEQQVRTREHQSALGEVAAYTAHNIQNPLAAIRASAQVTLDSADINDDLKEILTDIIKTVDRLSFWVKRFLNYAKPLELDRQPTDINNLLRQAAKVVQALPQSKPQVKFELCDPDPVVPVDPGLLEQAIAALISNGLDSGGDEVVISSAVNGQAEEGRSVIIKIRDNGKGVSERIRKRLFQPFATDKDGGTGLGLPQAKRIVNLHGGELSLESEPGKGTTVTAVLPIIDNENNTTDNSDSDEDI